MTRKLSLGIDLGTSNSCVSLCAVDGGPAQTVPITQVLAPGVIGEKPLLPSVLYMPAPGEYADGSFALPWSKAEARGSIVGSFARERGATVPDRVVSSAKSWLCNPDVDRHAAILPWQLGPGRREGFAVRSLAALPRPPAPRGGSPPRPARRGATLADCQIVLTVPASFDEVARTLTHEAALAVGLADVTLLEEPQAAFYAWINQSAHAPGRDAVDRRGGAGRPRPGLRHRRRHGGLQPDRRRGGARRTVEEPGIAPHRRRRAHPARRRQHGPGARLRPARQARGGRARTRCLAVPGPGARHARSPRKSCSATTRWRRRRSPCRRAAPACSPRPWPRRSRATKWWRS